MPICNLVFASIFYRIVSTNKLEKFGEEVESRLIFSHGLLKAAETL